MPKCSPSNRPDVRHVIGHLEVALADADRDPGTPLETAYAIVSLLAGYCLEAGRSADAERHAARLVGLAQGIHGPSSYEAAVARCYLGSLFLLRGELEQAEQLYRQALPVFRDRGGAGRRTLQTCLMDLCKIYLLSGRFQEAVAVTQERADRLRELPRPTRRERRELAEAEELIGDLRDIIRNAG